MDNVLRRKWNLRKVGDCQVVPGETVECDTFLVWAADGQSD